MSTPWSHALTVLTVLAMAAPALAQAPDPALVARARAIHERVITLDTHDDIDPRNFTKTRNYTQRLDTQVNLPKMEEGGLDVAFFIVYVGQGPLTPGRLRQGLRPGGGEVRRRAPAHQGDRAGPHRPGAHRRRRAADRRLGPQGGGDRHRERLPGGHQPGPHQGVPRPRRPLHVARPQRPQPVRRLEHRRARRQVAAQRAERAGQAGHRRDEPLGPDGRRLAPVEAGQPAGDRAVEGAGHRVALGGAGAGQPQPQPRRRAAAGDQEERRRGADGGVRRLREDQAARLTGARRGAGQGARRHAAGRPAAR